MWMEMGTKYISVAMLKTYNEQGILADYVVTV